MWTARAVSSADLELDDRARLEGALGLPVIGSGDVEPEGRRVEERRPEGEDAPGAFGRVPHLRCRADQALAAPLRRVAHPHPDLSRALHTHLEGRALAGRDGRAGPGRERRDAARGVRGSGGGSKGQRDRAGEEAGSHARTVTAMIRAVSRVFVTRDMPFPALERLKAEHEVDVWEHRTPPPPDEFAARAARADALLTTVTERVDGDLLDAAPSVKAVANLAVGTDNIDLEAAKARGIPVGNTPDVLTDATADIAFALLLAAARRITEGEREVREGRWAPWHPAHMLGGDLAGTTLGIIGWGRIGQAMARRGEGFGMEIVHHSRSSGIPLDELLERSDHVSLHTPLTPETRHLMGAEQFARMKPTAYFVNTSRGGTVDQVALREALERGEIAGAALDVTDPQPLPRDDPLLLAPNLVVVPHVGSAAVRTRSKMADLAVENLLAALGGREMPHRVA